MGGPIGWPVAASQACTILRAEILPSRIPLAATIVWPSGLNATAP